MRSILIAEDDPHITSFVRRGLRAAGYDTSEAADGHTALLMARGGMFDLVLLDIGLGGMDGFDVLANLRGEGVATPVIILTARDSVIDTVRGLESGANDYVTKPFQFAELAARVRLRIGDGEGRSAGPVLEHEDVRVDVRARTVTVAGDMRELTSREFALLEVFLQNAGQVLSRDQLIGHVWGMDFDPASNVVDVYVRALRGKIGADRIETVRGAGYRFR
ncbi:MULTISPECIES: response regulator transcription factor [unclassified Microbacterium]|uniref:response regulator transcription factor n=1 Tax=unclassified Microbacterium TaxID=2609290 RepID=UPI000EA8A3EE|nr:MULTISPECIES: response regulator transcription factor [unclassified Microbacterium]MBT2483312.1 response regulator transcription factor [Microbacterium sp. ISL-108]RKN66349.1 DNA-binding response regulator [Microbacterium sp. CGR2]